VAESPDTPNVCPTSDGVHVDVVSAIHQFCNADWSGDDFNDWAEDLATEILSVMPATPAAPGSSSPDVAALAERLRDDGLQARHHDEVLTADDACRWGGVGALLWAEDMFKAADALEAQAARITELEAALADVHPRHPRQETT